MATPDKTLGKPGLPAPVPVALPEGSYTFTLSPAEEEELRTVPLADQARWLKALANQKRPVGIPGPVEST